jgi:dissimilatory sulfite reductase (desulfoviridin) alpha/beta subunit
MDQKVTKKPAPLIKHMQDAAASDINPWMRGYGQEVFSDFVYKHPSVDRQISLELFSKGWLSAEALYLAAEIAESRGAQLAEISGPQRSLRFLGLSPEGREIPWNTFLKMGLEPHLTSPKPGCCPLWGPCLGRKSYLSEALEELAAEIEPQIIDDFMVELAGCPKDCRQASSRADLALIFDSVDYNFVVWIGGRHQPFKDTVLPHRWLKEDLSNFRKLLDVIFKVHDMWQNLAVPPETLPELVKRIGLDNFESFMATGLKPRNIHRPAPKDGKN